jgi:hypothetical protein
MITTDVRGSDTAGTPRVATFDMKVEVIVIPVADVDRAKEFYLRLGWRLDVTPPPWSSSPHPVPPAPSSSGPASPRRRRVPAMGT